MELHPEILKKNGRPEFAVLPYEEYLELERVLSDAQDLIDLREAKGVEHGVPGSSLEAAKRELGL